MNASVLANLGSQERDEIGKKLSRAENWKKMGGAESQSMSSFLMLFMNYIK